MTGKRCTDCRYTKGIGYDFWCGEGHTEYEVFGAETNCPYYEYHDWSKGIPSKTVKRFEVTFNGSDFNLKDNETCEEFKLVDEKVCYDYIADRWNALYEENEYLHKYNNKLQKQPLLFDVKTIPDTMEIMEANTQLEKENEQLKQQLQDVKNNEKQLSISFMGYKMQLIDVLQENYNYAYSQRQKNLDKTMVARSYELLYQTIDIIAETMNVDIERFPKR